MKYNDIRKKTKELRVGSTSIGGRSPIAIQSMTNTDSDLFEPTYAQIKALQDAGCDIVRLTVPDMGAVKTVARLKESDIRIPLVADIHFDYRLAVEAAAAGIDKIRINPGNIGDEERVKAVVRACRDRHIPIRIGVNSGSLDKQILARYGSPTAEALCESALQHIAILERNDFTDIAVSIKSSDVLTMINANRLLSESCAYPLHLGVTESGHGEAGKLKSAVGIGALLSRGIGDTIRVSLTDDPVEEVAAAKNILKAVSLYEGGYINVISCPTCGRTRIDLIPICRELEKRFSAIRTDKKITVAVMGCAVNGPGEASEADVGIAGGKGEAVLFRKGQIIRKIKEEEIADELTKEVERLLEKD